MTAFSIDLEANFKLFLNYLSENMINKILIQLLGKYSKNYDNFLKTS